MRVYGFFWSRGNSADLSGAVCREICNRGCIAHFKFHNEPIVSVDWHPSDETALAVASADNKVTLWDMSVEADIETNESKDETLEGVPPQLMFVHEGQRDVKEVKHHPQVPGMVITTAATGFNFFIPNLAPPMPDT